MPEHSDKQSATQKAQPQKKPNAFAPVEADYSDWEQVPNKTLAAAISNPSAETLTPNVVRRLQMTHGNAFVQRLAARIQRNPTQPYSPEEGVIDEGEATEGVVQTKRLPDKIIRRVRWFPNTPTGRGSYPWGSGPHGQILQGATDAGTAIDIWKPDDGTTYWCHGYTFGGSTARGGPYSVWGNNVPTILRDDGWQREPACLAKNGDILVFYDDQNRVMHTGIIRSVSAPNSQVDETASTLESKWGSAPLNTSSWERNIRQYGSYRCYSKNPNSGPCNGSGAHELT